MQETALIRVRGTRTLGVRVEQALQVPAAVLGESGDGVPALGHHLPQVLRPRHATGQSARHAHDGDRLTGSVEELAVLLLQRADLFQRLPQRLDDLFI